MRYIPHTEEDIRKMLETAGAASLDELFESLPEKLCCKGLLDLPDRMDEQSLMRHIRVQAAQCEGAGMLCFLGGGSYHHHTPPAVDQILMRSELLTAYTPYQPEISQGTLQSIFEFQTVIARLFGLDVANASMYDGSTAMTEAALMLRRVTRRERILVSSAVHPEYRKVLATYLAGLDGKDMQMQEVPFDELTGETDTAALKQLLEDDVACVIAGYPDFFGVVEPMDRISSVCREAGCHLITVTQEPYSMGILKPPGEIGASVAVGEGHAFASTPSFGGPGIGLLCSISDRKFLRQIPGRLAGATVDSSDEPGYVLTLATREQHIRREKATSNICTNHGLMAVAATIRLSLLGRTGFTKIASLCMNKANYLKEKLESIPGLEARFTGSVFNEFALRFKDGKPASDFLAKLEDQGILGGIDLGKFYPDMGDSFMLSVTELHRREDLDRMYEACRAIV